MRPELLDHGGYRYAVHRLDDEKQHAHGWGDEADHHVEHQHHTQMHEVDAKRQSGRNEQWHDDELDGRDVEEAAQDEEEDVQQQQEQPGFHLIVGEEFIDHLRDALDGNDVVEDEGAAEHDR